MLGLFSILPHKPLFSFSTNARSPLFYPKQSINFLNGRCRLTNLPIDLMRKGLRSMTIMQAIILFGSSYYIAKNYENHKSWQLLKLILAGSLSIVSLRFFIRYFSRAKRIIFKIELANDGKHIFATQITRFWKFNEKKIPIEKIKPALESKVPTKWHRMGRPFMIDNEVFLFFKDSKGQQVCEETKEIFEAVLLGQEIFVGEQEIKLNTNENTETFKTNI